jgi:hypothetical protein
MHVFWRCEGALAVRAALLAELAHLGVLAPLRRRQLWLMLRPSRAIQDELWRFLCFSAFACMDEWSLRGLARAARLRRRRQGRPSPPQRGGGPSQHGSIPFQR